MIWLLIGHRGVGKSKLGRLTAEILGRPFIDIDKNAGVIYANAHDPKQFVRVAGANHSDVPQMMGLSTYENLIRTFVQSH